MHFGNASSSFGYYRGASPSMADRGSGQGTESGVGGTGVAKGVFTAGTTNNQGTWNPTVLYLFVLIIAEMFIFAFISKHL